MTVVRDKTVNQLSLQYKLYPGEFSGVLKTGGYSKYNMRLSHNSRFEGGSETKESRQLLEAGDKGTVSPQGLWKKQSACGALVLVP